MNKIIKNNIGIISTTLVTLSLLSLTGFAGATTFAPINSQLGFGATGNEVIKLQTFLASNQHLYPSGIISGYYGNLTRNAVMQFQLYYGIPAIGRVGPMTLAKMNEAISSGYGIDIYAPIVSNIAVQKTNTSATFTWYTSESAKGKLFYSTTPFNIRESGGMHTEPTIIGGTNVLAINFQNSQTITIQGLQPNTLYYYIIESTDASGNIGVTTQSTFTTNL